MLCNWRRRYRGVAPVAAYALELVPNPLRPARFRQHPGTELPWRLMPHMLAVAAGELGHPMPFVIAVESDDGLLHGALCCFTARYARRQQRDPACLFVALAGGNEIAHHERHQRADRGGNQAPMTVRRIGFEAQQRHATALAEQIGEQV
jgi:hypothetical protein